MAFSVFTVMTLLRELIHFNWACADVKSPHIALLKLVTGSNALIINIQSCKQRVLSFLFPAGSSFLLYVSKASAQPFILGVNGVEGQLIITL